MLLEEYVSLSFSFMTLVIRDKQQQLQKNEEDEYQDDLEMYRWNINKKTFLTCDNFVTFSYEKLELALKYLHATDKDLLEMLHYYFTEEQDDGDDKTVLQKITPLYLGLSNNRSANIILQYMAYVDYNASETFKDIMYKCVE